MSNHMICGALAVSALFLTACEKVRPDPVAPRVDAGMPDVSQRASTSPDASVPPAGSVLASPATVTKKDVPGTRSNATLTRAEESSAMPMPGQANDHSAALAPGSRASAP
jgi:hypothetical protein